MIEVSWLFSHWRVRCSRVRTKDMQKITRLILAMTKPSFHDFRCSGSCFSFPWPSLYSMPIAWLSLRLSGTGDWGYSSPGEDSTRVLSLSDDCRLPGACGSEVSFVCELFAPGLCGEWPLAVFSMTMGRCWSPFDINVDSNLERLELRCLRRGTEISLLILESKQPAK